MVVKRELVLAGAALVLLAGCARKKEEAAYLQTGFVMSTQAHVKVYGAPPEEGKRIADAVFAEWKRVDDEYSFGSPYSAVAHVNGKAYGEWVRVDDEFLGLLAKSMEYFRLTDGAFDITFAPLWPIWKEAASSRKMPPKEEIAGALSNMGSRHILVDYPRKLVRFLKPVQINMGGVLRGYCMERGRLVLERAAAAYPVELKLGGNILAYGKRDWSYPAPDPFHEGGSLGSFRFDEGFIMSSSGRDHFVQIGGRLYSHILDLKTGYPIPDFSNLIVYYPKAAGGEYISSSVLAVMGKEKAFGMLSRMKGAAAVWIDGSGRVEFFGNADSKARWEKNRSLF